MEIYFIRHGHAAHNQGFDDFGEAAYFSPEFMYSELTEKGHLQTISLDTQMTVDAILVSPLVRCIQTARNIFGDHRTLYLHDGLLESQGEHPCNMREGKEVIREKYPNIDVSGVRTLYAPTLESYEDVKERAKTAMTDILRKATKNNYTRIAIVSHHNWLHAILGVSLRNAEVYRMYYSTEKIRKCIG